MNAGNRGLRSDQLSRGQKIIRTVQAATRILLGAFLVLAGTSHLTVARAEFLAQVPTWLPVDGDLVVVLSGIAEIALGLALIFLVKQRVLVGLAAAAFFMRALGIPSKNEVHVLLVDRQGSILWRTTGSFDEAKGRALAGAIAAQRPPDASHGRPPDTI